MSATDSFSSAKRRSWNSKSDHRDRVWEAPFNVFDRRDHRFLDPAAKLDERVTNWGRGSLFMKMADGICSYCLARSDDLCREHVASRPPEEDTWNLAVACRRCNCIKRQGLVVCMLRDQRGWYWRDPSGFAIGTDTFHFDTGRLFEMGYRQLASEQIAEREQRSARRRARKAGATIGAIVTVIAPWLTLGDT